MEREEKRGRGGARPGAGRKAGRARKTAAISLPLNMWEAIDAAAAQSGLTRSKWLERLVRERIAGIEKELKVG